MDAERAALTTLCREFDALIGETGLHSPARQELLARIVTEALGPGARCSPCWASC